MIRTALQFQAVVADLQACPNILILTLLVKLIYKTQTRTLSIDENVVMQGLLCS